jgi:hypothetical protein
MLEHERYESYPNGIEFADDKVYINCACGKRIYWMKRTFSSMRYPLPEGWTHLSPIFGGEILCPECGEAWDKRHDLQKTTRAA